MIHRIDLRFRNLRISPSGKLHFTITLNEISPRFRDFMRHSTNMLGFFLEQIDQLTILLRFRDFMSRSRTSRLEIYRNYVESSRSKDIGNHWPFSQQYLHLCLNHGLRNLLPPFEPMKSRNEIAIIESVTDKCKENSSPISVMPSDLISTKICPVCKSFSSSSNTTLNAHIDQCLLDGTEIGRTTKVKFKTKGKKKRSMAEILDSAPISTIEDLDRRNGTNWAVDLGLIRVSGEVGISAESSGTNSGVLSERRIEDWRGRSSRSAKKRKKLEREKTPEKAMAEVKIKDAESLNSSKRETPSISSVLLDAEHDDHHVHVHDHHHDDALLEVSSTKTRSSIPETEDDHPRSRVSEDNPRDFDLNSEFLSLDEPPVLENSTSFKKSSVIRLMGKNLVVMHREDEEREREPEKREERETFSWVLPSREKFQTGVETWRYRLLPPAM